MELFSIKNKIVIPDYNNTRELLIKKGLKATTQRLIIFETIAKMQSHPTAEDIHSEIAKSFPSISLSTIYNTLETFLSNGLITTVKSDTNTVRYDAIRQPHHHIYCEDNNTIEDYYNSELDKILAEFFTKNQIKNFKISEVILQINGRYIKKEER